MQYSLHCQDCNSCRQGHVKHSACHVICAKTQQGDTGCKLTGSYLRIGRCTGISSLRSPAFHAALQLVDALT